ncbi:histidine triad (HIT) family protein [Thermotomaculum hydrothermale]|uniref:Histidine triad (HIT) family protein n=1 Tax=Thermotomaculum hydrothermale TaxID=981385 RepID=A0A7R6SZ59_9BACT|nr:histidine triad nucleotide-binding protein [Thermotomaculum hydrothermale]BBB32417.1 histidine triad (HIT) family protein [Thermotomaculum hydrothermale]
MDCIFCKIANKEIPSSIVFENDRVIAFRDINPVAPVHILVIPKNHVESVQHLNEEHYDDLKEIFKAIKEIAVKEGIDKTGYRVISNYGKDGGQEVNHLHFHILGGETIGKLRCK